MDSKIVSKPNEVLQEKLQNGPLLLSRLRYKVARLEVAVRDREAQILKLQASTKVTTVNELKLQSQIYYDEILRLKSQLNFLQNQQQPQVHQHRPQPLARVPPNPKTSENKKREKKLLSKQTPSPSNDATSPMPSLPVKKLEEENRQLYQKLAQLEIEKINLEREKNLLGRSSNEQVDKISHRGAEHSEEQKRFIEALKSEVMELKSREKAWEEERGAYKEILINLKEDRLFFKDISLKKEEDMEVLQREVVKLQREVLTIQKEVAESNLKPVSSCLMCSERRKWNATVATANASTETSHLDKKLAKNGHLSSEKVSPRIEDCHRRPPHPTKRDTHKRSTSKSSHSSGRHQNSPENLNHRPSTPSSCSSHPSSAAASPSHSHKAVVSSRATPACESESHALSKSSTPSSPSSFSTSAQSKQAKASPVRRSSLNTISKSSRDSSKSAHSSRRTSHAGTTSSSPRGSALSHEASNSESNCKHKNSIKAPIQDSPSTQHKAEERVETRLKDTQEISQSLSADGVGEEPRVCTSSPPQRDWLDDEVAHEIIKSEKEVLQASYATSSILESHFRRKAMLGELASCDITLPPKTEHSPPDGGSSSPKSYLQMESTSSLASHQVISLLQSHFARLSILSQMKS